MIIHVFTWLTTFAKVLVYLSFCREKKWQICASLTCFLFEKRFEGIPAIRLLLVRTKCSQVFLPDRSTYNQMRNYHSGISDHRHRWFFFFNFPSRFPPRQKNKLRAILGKRSNISKKPNYQPFTRLVSIERKQLLRRTHSFTTESSESFNKARTMFLDVGQQMFFCK